MCLAIPAKVKSLNADNLATVDILGVTREVSLDLTPQAGEGDFVLVHAGFAIEVVDEQFAQETLDLIKEFPELAGEDMEEIKASETITQGFSNPMAALAQEIEAEDSKA